MFGIENVWKGANEGRGLRLLAEKDYDCPAFISGKKELRLDPSSNRGDGKFSNAINGIINIVLEKNGELIVTGRSSLDNYGKIALINRYWKM